MLPLGKKKQYALSNVPEACGDQYSTVNARYMLQFYIVFFLLVTSILSN
jgi:hypothetical protein